MKKVALQSILGIALVLIIMFALNYLLAMGIVYVLRELSIVDWSGKELIVAFAIFLIGLVLKK